MSLRNLIFASSNRQKITLPPPRKIERSTMTVLLAGVVTLLLLVAHWAEAQTQSAPRVTHIENLGWTSTSATFGLDATFHIQVVFDKPVKMTGKPQLVVEIGSRKRNLDIISGYHAPYYFPAASVWRALTFEYYVQASEVGPVVATGIDLNGGTIQAENGEAANLVFERTEIPGPGGQRFSVDGRQRRSGHGDHSCNPPYPYTWPSGGTWQTDPQSGDTYRAGEEIQMVVRCIVALTVTGTPQVPLIIGGTTRYADYVPTLSGASALVFSYTVQKTDYDNDGIQYNGPTPWRMNGGSVVLRGHKTAATILPASYTTDWIYIN